MGHPSGARAGDRCGRCVLLSFNLSASGARSLGLRPFNLPRARAVAAVAAQEVNILACWASFWRSKKNRIVVIVVRVIATIAVVATVIVIPLRRHWLPRARRCCLARPVPRAGADVVRGTCRVCTLLRGQVATLRSLRRRGLLPRLLALLRPRAVLLWCAPAAAAAG